MLHVSSGSLDFPSVVCYILSSKRFSPTEISDQSERYPAMKLRNSFITAVFFSAGITFAFAEAPVDEDTFRETTYAFDRFSSADKLNAYALSFFQTSENNGGDSVQSEQNGITGTGSERNDYTIGYKNNGTSPSFHANSTSAAPDGNESLSQLVLRQRHGGNRLYRSRRKGKPARFLRFHPISAKRFPIAEPGNLLNAFL